METNEKSVFNEAGYQIQRLNTLWWQANNNLMRGDLNQYRWALECVELELMADVLRLEGTSIDELQGEEVRNKNFKHLLKINKNISVSTENKQQYFTALKEKHIFLKAIQEAGGKGGNYEDTNADDME